jgi:hypothetical protein
LRGTLDRLSVAELEKRLASARPRMNKIDDYLEGAEIDRAVQEVLAETPSTFDIRRPKSQHPESKKTKDGRLIWKIR